MPLRSVEKKERQKEGERKSVSQKSKSLVKKEAGHWKLSLLSGSMSSRQWRKMRELASHCLLEGYIEASPSRSTQQFSTASCPALSALLFSI